MDAVNKRSPEAPVPVSPTLVSIGVMQITQEHGYRQPAGVAGAGAGCSF